MQIYIIVFITTYSFKEIRCRNDCNIALKNFFNINNKILC